MAKKRRIPFKLMPASWGLVGKTREMAEAEYDLEGEELDRKKLEINISEKTEEELVLEGLKLDLKYKKITETEYEKAVAKEKEEPYIRVAKLETDPSNPAYGGIIFDYNEAFVLYLEEHGYGPNPDADETVNQWFNELCKNIALEAFDGLGDFNERMQEAQGQRRTSMSEDVILRANEDGSEGRSQDGDI